jgi:hypothetical protein
VALCAGGPSLRADDDLDEPPVVAEPPTAVLQPTPPPAPASPLAPVAAAPIPPVTAPPSPPSPPPPGPKQPIKGPGRSRRNLIPLIAIGIVLLGGGAAGAIVLAGNQGGSSTTVETAAAPVSDAELSAAEEEPLEGEEEGFEAAEEYESEEEPEPEAEPSASQLADRQVQQALRNHFNNLADGYYHAAYRDLTPTEGEEIGGESSWVGAQEEDELEGFELRVDTTLFDSSAARARIVEFQTRALATGCKQWSGYWEMSKVYGEWLISAAKLEDEPC